MKKQSSYTKFLAFRIFISFIGFAMPGMALAYLDPGSVSLLIQGLIGAIAATGAAVSLWWNDIKAFFGRRKNKTNAGNPGTATKDDDSGTK